MYNTEITDKVFSGVQCDTSSDYLCNSHIRSRKGHEVIALSIRLCFPVQKENILCFIFFCPLGDDSVLLLRIREDKKKHST